MKIKVKKMVLRGLDYSSDPDSINATEVINSISDGAKIAQMIMPVIDKVIGYFKKRDIISEDQK